MWIICLRDWWNKENFRFDICKRGYPEKGISYKAKRDGIPDSPRALDAINKYSLLFKKSNLHFKKSLIPGAEVF